MNSDQLKNELIKEFKEDIVNNIHCQVILEKMDEGEDLLGITKLLLAKLIGKDLIIGFYQRQNDEQDRIDAAKKLFNVPA